MRKEEVAVRFKKLSQDIFGRHRKIQFFPVINQTLRHEDVWGSRGISPRILYFATRWRQMVSLPLMPPYPRECSPRYLEGSVGPRADLDLLVKRRTSRHFRNRTSVVESTVVTILTELSWLLYMEILR
jgi:hypothetical protein